MSNIPSSWIVTKIEDVCHILDSARIPINAKERNARIEGRAQSELYPYYGATGEVGKIDGYLFEGEHILLGEDGAPFLDPFKDKAYLVDGKFWVNNHAHILTSSASNRFICHYFNKFNYSEYVTGTTRLKLNQSSLKEIPLPLPPLNEQKRIVAKIEVLFGELEAAVASLKTAQAQLKTYRQALLKHAFEGKLTAAWRAAHAGQLEDAHTLLHCIIAERQARYEAEVAAWERNGRRGQKPRPPKNLPSLTPAELDELPQLPAGWVWVKIAEIFGVYVGATPSRKIPDYWDGNISWVSSGEVAFCRIKQTKESITESGHAHSSTDIHPIGTVMLEMIGEGKTRGQAAILDIEAAHNQNTAAIRVSETDCLPEYLFHFCF
jgi:type I restriction enzyme, S subunit